MVWIGFGWQCVVAFSILMVGNIDGCAIGCGVVVFGGIGGKIGGGGKNDRFFFSIYIYMCMCIQYKSDTNLIQIQHITVVLVVVIIIIMSTIFRWW